MPSKASGPLEPFDRTRSLGYLAHLVARQVTHDLQRRIHGHGLAPAQLSVLLELAEQPGMTQRDLVERLRVDQSTMAHTVRRMRRDGLISSSGHESDARASRIWLSTEAIEILPKATQEAQLANRAALACLEAAEREQLLDLLARVASAAGSTDA